jgi:uncharacterized protein
MAWVAAPAESVESLPAPTDYVSDFAGVLSPQTIAQVDALCQSLDHQAHAQIAVVTIKTIDADKSGAVPSIEEFAVKLEEKWGVGTKGTDRGVLNDAKVGDIGRAMSPYAQKNDYDDAVQLGVKDLADVIAADAGVQLQTAPAQQQYHYEQVPQSPVKLWHVVVGGAVVVVILIVLASTGNLGILFWLLLNMMGGGGGGRGGGGGGFDGGGGGDSGGFGGFGGGRVEIFRPETGGAAERGSCRRRMRTGTYRRAKQ